MNHFSFFLINKELRKLCQKKLFTQPKTSRDVKLQKICVKYLKFVVTQKF